MLSPLNLVPLVVGAASATWIGTTRLLRYAHERGMIDQPNGRSSHTIATPRGGGLAFSAVSIAAMVVLALGGAIAPRVAAAVAGGAVLVVAVGWCEDRVAVPAPARLAVHFAAAAWAACWLGSLREMRVGDAVVHLGAAGYLAAAVYVVWWTNLYNFMDGIDGLAAANACVIAAALGTRRRTVVRGAPAPRVRARRREGMEPRLRHALLPGADQRLRHGRGAVPRAPARPGGGERRGGPPPRQPLQRAGVARAHAAAPSARRPRHRRGIAAARRGPLARGNARAQDPAGRVVTRPVPDRR